MDINLKQLKYLRGVLSVAKMYQPYEQRGDANLCPKGSLYNDDMEDLFIKIEAEIQRQSPNCPPWSPYGSFSTIIKESSKLNEFMATTQTLTLSPDEANLLQTVFASAAALDIDEKLDSDGDFTLQQFSQLWDKVNGVN